MGKKPAGESVQKDRFVWTPQMDDLLVEALYAQHVEGNRVDGNFTAKAYDKIIEELKQKIGPTIDKDKVKNRMKSIKTNFNECNDIFKGGLSGFGWSSTTKLWDAEEEVWTGLIEKRPEDVKWKNTPIGNYHKLCELFGKDRATGEGAETEKEKRLRGATEGENTFESNYEFDEFLARNDLVFDANNLNDDMELPSSNAPEKLVHGLSRKGKKKRVDASNEKEGEIMTIMQSIASAMSAPLQVAPLQVHNESQSDNYIRQRLWKELKAIGVDQPLITDAYLFLVDNSDKRAAFAGCPEEARLGVLMKMINK